jgi:hypothetical protein
MGWPARMPEPLNQVGSGRGWQLANFCVPACRCQQRTQEEKGIVGYPISALACTVCSDMHAGVRSLLQYKLQ